MKPSSKVELALSGVKRRIEILEQRNLRDSQEYRKLLAQREELFRKTQEYREIAGSRVASRLLGEREFEADIYRIGFKRHNHLFDPMFDQITKEIIAQFSALGKDHIVCGPK